jgi:hypothetical protein
MPPLQQNRVRLIHAHFGARVAAPPQSVAIRVGNFFAVTHMTGRARYTRGMTEPARITVTRTHAVDVRDRQIVVSIDREPLATLLFGQHATREVSAGPHRLKAHNTLFWRNLDVELEPGEHARFVVINRAGSGTLSLLGILGVGPLYLTFEREA